MSLVDNFLKQHNYYIYLIYTQVQCCAFLLWSISFCATIVGGFVSAKVASMTPMLEDL